MGSTLDNLKEAFAGESQANRKYLAFAKKADEEGHPQAARLFRAAAAAETVHANNHLNVIGDVGSTLDNLKAAYEGEHFEFELFDERKSLLKKSAAMGVEGVQEIKSSMPGKIVKILVGEGEEVEQGQGLVVVEAMKMENEIKSPKAGSVKKIGVEEGETVEAGAILVVVE